MTPPPRWVLLASLLAVVTAHCKRYNACVELRKLWKTSSEDIRFCDHQQELQSRTGKWSIEDYMSYCMAPCYVSDSTDFAVFDGSKKCLAFKDYLIGRVDCKWDKSNSRHEDKVRTVIQFLKNRIAFKLLRKVDGKSDVQNEPFFDSYTVRIIKNFLI